jgi:hypothetical protein
MRSELTCSLVAGLIYINTIPNDFVYDDRFVIWDGARAGGFREMSSTFTDQ